VREKSLIQQIRRRIPPGSSIPTGIGDDCAVLRIPAGHEVLVTTDFTLEDVHFRREWHPPEVVGWRCMTRGLSDIAAMGGEPRAAFLSLALGRDTPLRWVNGFLSGLLEAGAEFRVTLAGGDTAQSASGIAADIVLVGSVPKGKAVLRSGARPGDGIYITGELGGSAAALARMRKGKVRAADYERHFHPTARVEVGQWLRRTASAMIDISDGLSTDLEHICEESGVGAQIEMAAIPRAWVGRPARQVGLDLALHGGEDYELLFTSAKKIPAKVGGVPVTQIGRITRRRGMELVEGDGHHRRLVVRGWEHFRSLPAKRNVGRRSGADLSQ
jgi:thiamine-monophosphate kinase